MLATCPPAPPGVIPGHAPPSRATLASCVLARPSAEQMGKLQAMLDQGAELSKLGVTFVRPFPNCATLWSELPAG